MQCTGHSLLAFRSILHASPNGSALQVLTLQTGFPGLQVREALVGISPWEPLEDGRQGKARRLLPSLWALNVPLILTMGCSSQENLPRLQLLSVTPVDSDCSCHTDWEWLLLPLIRVSLILCHLCNQFSTLNPILMTCILVTAALIQWWSTHMWLRRPSVCESATIFNTAFCRKRQAASGKDESGWRADSAQDWFL